MDEERTKRLNKVKIRIMEAAKHELESGDISAMETLAVLSYCVGQCIALQDMTKVTPKMAMDLVSKNIQIGNMDAVIKRPRPQG